MKYCGADLSWSIYHLLLTQERIMMWKLSFPLNHFGFTTSVQIIAILYIFSKSCYRLILGGKALQAHKQWIWNAGIESSTCLITYAHVKWAAVFLHRKSLRWRPGWLTEWINAPRYHVSSSFPFTYINLSISSWLMIRLSGDFSLKHMTLHADCTVIWDDLT